MHRFAQIIARTLQRPHVLEIPVKLTIVLLVVTFDIRSKIRDGLES